MHWKKYFEKYWSLNAAFFNYQQIEAVTFRQKLVAHCKQLEIAGDVTLTSAIASYSVPPSTYSKYIGKKAILKAFAECNMSGVFSSKIFVHGSGAAGKTCFCYRVAMNEYPKE